MVSSMMSAKHFITLKWTINNSGIIIVYIIAI